MAKDKIAKAFLAITKDKFTIDTVAEMIATKYLAEGDIVRLNGYYSAGDGANHIRIISKTNDGSGILLANGLYANIVHEGEVNVSWFGAKGDGVTDDTLAIQKAFDTFNCVTSHPFKTYSITKGIVIKRYGFECDFKNSELYKITNDVSDCPDTVFDLGEGKKGVIKNNVDSVIQTYNPTYYVQHINIKNLTARHKTEGAYSFYFPCTVYSRYEGLLGKNSEVTLFNSVSYQNKYLRVQGQEIGRTFYEHIRPLANIGNSTSITFENCYGFVYKNDSRVKRGYYTYGLAYSSLINCATDGSHIAYEFNQSEITTIGCGAEDTKESFMKVYNGSYVVAINPSWALQKDENAQGVHAIALDHYAYLSIVEGIFQTNLLTKCIFQLTNSSNLDIYGGLRWGLGTGDTIDCDSSSGAKMFGKDSRSFGFDSGGKIVYTGMINTFTQPQLFKTGTNVELGKFNENLRMFVTGNNTDIADVVLAATGGDGTYQNGNLDIKAESISLRGQIIHSIYTTLKQFDTPYHAAQMSSLGILDSYHSYLTELHEYEKSQNVPEGVMNLNVVQPPVIPKEIEEYAKEYNLL